MPRHQTVSAQEIVSIMDDAEDIANKAHDIIDRSNSSAGCVAEPTEDEIRSIANAASALSSLVVRLLAQRRLQKQSAELSALRAGLPK